MSETVYCMCNPAIADDLNRALMRLLRPSHLRVGYTTDTLGQKHIHPITGYAALALDNEQAVPIHVEADGAELNALTDIFVRDGAMTQEEADQLEIDIAAAAGTSIVITEFIPPSWLPFVLTYEAMANDWWFPQEEEIKKRNI
jgi:hypothetical protein